MSAVPKSLTVAKSQNILHDVQGPPPKVVPVLVPFGELMDKGGKLANAAVSQESLTQLVVASQVLFLVSFLSTLDFCGRRALGWGRGVGVLSLRSCTQL